MKRSMTARDRRVLVVGIGVVLAGAGARLGPQIRTRLERQTTTRESVVAEAERMTASVQALPRTRARLAALHAQLSRYDSATVDGETPALAGANLAELVSTSASAAGAQLTSVQLLPTKEPRGGFGRVAAHANVTGDLEAIAIFIQGLEAGPQLVVVRSFGVTQPEINLPSSRRESLRAEVEVEALFRAAREAKR
jgi:hypothetical protein